MQIPAGITKTDSRNAIADLRVGIEHSFGKPNGYLLWDAAQSFAPKAVIGLVARRVNGSEPLHHTEFRSGVASGQAVAELRRLSDHIRRVITPTKRLSAHYRQPHSTGSQRERAHRKSRLHRSLLAPNAAKAMPLLGTVARK